ncbi:hypothetical protein CBF23_013440 [Marinomonas agarivorans]|nr:hypothetical protein CBF23_013440 [Marinomonas agarivorans]
MMIWLLPSAIALLMKVFLFFYSDVHKKKYFFTFLVLTFTLNLLELLGFFSLAQNSTALKLYYFTAVFTFFYLAVVCSDISQSCQWLKSDFLLVAVSILAVTIFLTSYMVVDFKPLPNGSITKVAGEYYFIFQIYAISILLLALNVLIRRLVTRCDYQLRVQCLIALLAFTPFILVILSLMFVMQLGYQINMVGFLSLATSFMLLMFISLSDKHKLFTMMSFVPFSRERQYRLKLLKLMRQFDGPIVGQHINIKAILKEVEGVVIDHTNHYFPTQKEVAKMLTISESSLSRKVDRQTKEPQDED